MTSITEERRRLAEVGMRLRQRGEWGSGFDYTTARTVDEPADHQFVHISVTNPGSYSSNDAHVRAIEAIGKFRFPATGISYNRLILPGGQCYEGQPIGRRGAHTINDDERVTCSTDGCPSLGRSLTGPGWNLNYNGRAYCMARNCGDPVKTVDVEAMARALAADRLAGFVKRTATLHGHRCCSTKSCPCDPTWGLMGQVEARMNHYLTLGSVAIEEDPDVADITDNAANRSLIIECVMSALNKGDTYRTDTDLQAELARLGLNTANRSLRFCAEFAAAQAAKGLDAVNNLDLTEIPTPTLQAYADAVCAELGRRAMTPVPTEAAPTEA